MTKNQRQLFRRKKKKLKNDCKECFVVHKKAKHDGNGMYSANLTAEEMDHDKLWIELET